MKKLESENGNSSGEWNNGQLLRDIEEISRALYLHKGPSNATRSQSAGKARVLESKSNLNPRLLREELLYRDNKSSSTWDWKKPLKALTHIGNKKFYCCFFLNVHSIEGLPVNFNGLNLRVHWKRKNEVLQTSSSMVSQGVAEFGDTLMHQCSVYGSRSGPNNPVKYEPKHFLLYPSVVEASGLDIGKQWIDLTSLLPLTLEDLEGEKSRGKWTTSFNLSGKAKGARINVSFGFFVMPEKSVKVSGNLNFPELLNLVQNTSSTMDDGVSLTSSNSNGSDYLSESLDVKVCHEVLLRTGLELSKSISFLYQKLDEGNLCSSAKADSQQVDQLKPKLELDFGCAEEIKGYDGDITEFSITEVGTEMSETVQLALDKDASHTIDESAIETINFDDFIKDCDIDIDNDSMLISKDERCINYENEDMVDRGKHEMHYKCSEGLTMEEVELAYHRRLISESADLCPPIYSQENIEQENLKEAELNCKTNESHKRSFSLDDVAESVTSDFLNMLGVEDSSSARSSDGDPESPRERLLRQFEKEAQVLGNFIIDFDTKQEQSEFGCNVASGLDSTGYSEDSELSSIIRAAEEEHKSASELLKRRNAKVLEDLETEALLREWGLNERDFQNSPRSFSGGFGSPIDLSPEKPLQLPPLEEGFGPYVQMKRGGFLQSMNPSLFKNAKNGGSLIIQVSSPVVLPTKMGYDIMEILELLASIGAEKLYMQIVELMPLDDITGKTIKQVAGGADPSLTAPHRQALLQHDSNGGREKVERFPNDQSPGLICDEMPSKFVSLEDLSHLIVNKIEALSIEGLRIQARMSDEEAPSYIHPQFMGKMPASGSKSTSFGEFLSLEGVGGLQIRDDIDTGNYIEALLGLSISLDEWLKLDAGNIGDEDHDNEYILKILSAHNTKCIDLGSGQLKEEIHWHKQSRRECGLLGNNLTVAHLVQLRDPLRNYEPVGVPMLVLIQVQRVFSPSMQKGHSVVWQRCEEKEHDQPVTETTKEDEGDSYHFRINEIHLAGSNAAPGNRQPWGTITQQQSSSRWLLATGLGKTTSHTYSTSKAIVKSSSRLGLAKRQPNDILWSISSQVHSPESTWENMVTSHTRNPDIIFQSETFRPHVTNNF
ncbi:hypothetical protein UlMin_035700 [Ulmus minor]